MAAHSGSAPAKSGPKSVSAGGPVLILPHRFRPPASVSGPILRGIPLWPLAAIQAGGVVMNWWAWSLIAIAAVLVISFFVALPDARRYLRIRRM